MEKLASQVREDSKSSEGFKQEEELITELRSHLKQFKTHEPWLRKLLQKKFSKDQVIEAEGRRCVVSVTGLKYHDLAIFFQVSEFSVSEVEPFEGWDTWIEVPLFIIDDVLAKTLSGEEDALSEAAGDNRVKIRGKKTYFDIAIFNEAFNLLARNIRRYKEWL